MASDIAIATISLARNDAEARVLLRALACLSRRRSDIFLADGGSCPSFREALTGLPITVVPVDERGLVAQVRAALGAAAASGARRVLYTEPDKHEFFDRHLAAFLDTAGAAGEPVALAARSAAAFETFPPFQRFTESIFNRLCAEFIAGPSDFLYGPFLVDSSLAATVTQVDGALGWGWRPFVFATAHRLGQGIASIVGDYACPQDQRHDPERLHRLRQLQQNVAGLVAAFDAQL